MRGPGSKPSLLFQLVIPATSIFAITVLSMIAILFSDERAPLARWLNKNGNSLLAAEFVVVIVLSVLAMTIDRMQTLRRLKDEQIQSALPADKQSDENSSPSKPGAS